MKLHNHTTLYLSATFAVVMGVWAFLMYLSMLDEIYDSIDDGLENYKMLIIERAGADTSILDKSDFNESNYAITPVSVSPSARVKDRYIDTLMYMLNEDDFEPVRMLHTDFEQSGKRYHLRVINSMVEEDDLIADLLSYLLLLYGFIIVSVVVVNNLLLRRLWRPFQSILTHLQNFDLRDPLPLKTGRTRISEFNDLAVSVERLLRNNIDRYTSQKQFIENASHELQTPLAICISKLELLLEDESLAGSHGQALADVLDNLNRLTRLNKALILISNIENRQYAETAGIVFNDLLKKSVDDFQPLAEYHHISVSVKENERFVFRMNRDLAVILVTNMVRNAIVHNQEGGDVQVVVNAGSFSVSNPGKRELDRNLLFSRFYRDKVKSQSVGLGLSIVHGICELSGLRIRYGYHQQTHTFTVSAGD